MTAEIAILNQEAVALATDSAVTVGGSAQKIYPSANKIFMLSKYHPVGIMIYNSARFLDVHWETIIKIYREHLGNKCFATLHGYGEDLLNFVEKNRKLFPETQQNKHNRNNIFHLFWKIEEAYRRYSVSGVGNLQKDSADLERILNDEIDGILAFLKKCPEMKTLNCSPLSNKMKSKIEKHYQQRIHEDIDEIFGPLSLSSSITQKIMNIAKLSLTRLQCNDLFTGVVISGYGSDDIFPSLVSYTLESIICNKLKFTKVRSVDIGFNNPAYIKPFAQSDMVSMFVEGIAPDFDTKLKDLLLESYIQIYTMIADRFLSLPKESEERKTLQKIVGDVYNVFTRRLGRIKQEEFIQALMDIVVSLPKIEIANMAETMVHLTSFRRKFSKDAETVGGPIDVALISKGDGFVWIKRKHYFDRKHNEHFFSNYLRRSVGGKDKG